MPQRECVRRCLAIAALALLAGATLPPLARASALEAQAVSAESALPLVAFSGRSLHLLSAATRAPIATSQLEQIPEMAVYSPDGRSVYVLTAGRLEATQDARGVLGRLVMLDAATGEAEATLPLGWKPSRLILADEGRRLYCLNEGSAKPSQQTGQERASVTVIDTAARKTAAVLTVPPNPIDMVLSQETGRLYVASAGYKRPQTPEQGPSLTAIDAATGRILSTLPLGGVAKQMELLDGFLYTVVEEKGLDRDQVIILDVASNQAISPITVERTSQPLTVNPREPIVYLAAGRSFTVIGKGKALATHSLDKDIARVEVSDDGSRAVVLTKGSIFVLNDSGRTLAGRIDKPAMLGGASGTTLSLSPDGRRTVLTGPMDAGILVVDNDAVREIGHSMQFGRKSVVWGKAFASALGTVGAMYVGPLSLSFSYPIQSGQGLNAEAVAFSEDSKRVFAANPVTGDVCVFDLDSGDRLAMVQLRGARGVVAPPGAGYLYGLGTEELLVLDRTSLKEIPAMRHQVVRGMQLEPGLRHTFVFTASQIDVFDNVEGREEEPIPSVKEARLMVFPAPNGGPS